jgi:hypothetical protein
MKCFIVWPFIIALIGCTTLRPIDGTPAELQQLINSGELLKPGDHVRIVTPDEKAHRFAITKIEGGLIVGPNESVPVDQVMCVEKRQFRKIESPVSFSFDKEVVIDSLIAIAAFALKPSRVDATP